MMRLKQWGAVLMGCAALLLTACTVVDLDENGKPVLPADPNAKPSFDHLTPQQIAQQTWQSRVIDCSEPTCAGRDCAGKSAPGVWRYATERLCPPEQRGDRD